MTIILQQASSRNSYYINTYQTTTYYQCFKKQGSDHVTLFFRGSAVEQNIQNMINAKNAELSIGVVYVACRAMAPEEQIQIIVKNIGLSAID